MRSAELTMKLLSIWLGILALRPNGFGTWSFTFQLYASRWRECCWRTRRVHGGRDVGEVV
jgi:hypothetical protein